MLLATARTDIAGVLSAIIYVYTIIIIVYIVIQLLFAAGLRPPYSRASDAVLQFLRDTVEPFLRIFRRLLPQLRRLRLQPDPRDHLAAADQLDRGRKNHPWLERRSRRAPRSSPRSA